MFVYGDPIGVPPDAGRDLMERKRRLLEETLLGLTEKAEALAAGGPSGGAASPDAPGIRS